jgi:HEAT repeat protein
VKQNRRSAAFVTLLLTASFILSVASLGSAGPWQAEGGRTPSPKKEKELLAVLRSDAPRAKKADACKDLAVYGSPEAVPDLAKLLADEQLASWARIALEVIPGPATDEALRKSVETLQGKLLVGAINSVGVRRDAAAVTALTGRLQDSNADVASAAAVALGRIGNAAAVQALQASLAAAPKQVRSAVAEGLVLCAERSMSEGRLAQASEIYDAVRKADVPRQRVLEATRGAILSRKEQGIALLLEQLRSPDKRAFQVALGTSREIAGRQVDEALAAELDRATPERAALLIGAMADRKATVVLAALLKAASKGPQPVRIAAVAALGRAGDASCLSPLLDIALESDADLAQSAKSALIELPGQNVNQEIVTRLSGAQGKIYPLLLEVVGERRIKAVDDVVKALDNSDDAVRVAALKALGTTVPADKLSVLVAQVVAPQHAEDATPAQRALKAACVRMPDRDVCAKELAGAMERASVPTKVELLKILGAVGGGEALASIGAAAKASDPEVQDASSRLLGEWMTIDAAPVLLDLSKSAPGDKYRVRALRGYIRIARQFVMSEQQRCEMCQAAFDAATQAAERKLVLDVLKRYRNLGSLQLAAKITREAPNMNKEATQATLAIARELGDEKHSGTADEVRDIVAHAKLGKVKLEIVKAEFGAAGKQNDVTKPLQQLVGDVQFVKLPAPNYVAAFGGDPAPGIVKQLKIQYRIDGKSGEATFVENALIILPTLK